MPTEAEIIAKEKSDYYALKGIYKNPIPWLRRNSITMSVAGRNH